jgi:hypothetical protein
MVVRMARGFARLEFPSTYTMLRDSLLLSALSINVYYVLRFLIEKVIMLVSANPRVNLP